MKKTSNDDLRKIAEAGRSRVVFVAVTLAELDHSDHDHGHGHDLRE